MSIYKQNWRGPAQAWPGPVRLIKNKYGKDRGVTPPRYLPAPPLEPWSQGSLCRVDMDRAPCDGLLHILGASGGTSVYQLCRVQFQLVAAQLLVQVPVSPWCGAGEGGSADCRGGEWIQGTLSTAGRAGPLTSCD